MEPIADVSVTAADAAWLADFTRAVVTDRLAACGNILPRIRSIYRWVGTIEDEDEALVVFHTRRVDRLVVLCTSAHLPPAQGWRDRAEAVRSGGPESVVDAVVEGRWYTAGFVARETEQVARAKKMFLTTSREGYAGCCEAIADMDLRAELPSITAPTLAIAGADDPATPPSHLEAIATRVRDGRVLVVPAAAHLANDEQPTRVGLAIAAHLGLGPTGPEGN